MHPTLTISETDLVVVGAGLAGLTTALAAAPKRATVLTKTGARGDGSSWLAQGGVAAVWGPDDTIETHVRDTMATGDNIGDGALIQILARGAPAAVRGLIDRGMAFDRNAYGEIDLTREGGHTKRRILHAGGDATGRGLMAILLAAAEAEPSVTVSRNAFAWDLVVDEGRIAGLIAYHEHDGWIFHRTANVVLASGGAGRLFGRTTNPPEATGDAVALAGRAGAALKDLEFVQFHPTALAAHREDGGKDDEAAMALLTEALRGEGAVLVDETGTRFMTEIHRDAELAPRDVVARAVETKLRAGSQIYLDARDKPGPEIETRFPTVAAQCRRAGIDPVAEPIPVAPAAHYHMGGVAVDGDGRTTLAGLWACGEAAASGLHGANRMAGNSLAECLVFGRLVAMAIEEGWPREGTSPPLPVPPFTAPTTASAGRVAWLRRRAQALMYDGMGLFRDEQSLARAIEGLGGIGRELHAGSAEVGRGYATVREWGELRNMLLTGRLIGEAARDHRGSLGVHARIDYPGRAATWNRVREMRAGDELAA
ncbi:MAG: L-aspartate oxidase [Alphaproteobacteria bacterium]|nr:L-aspartate oxidase [Alphaproteobacteria bacterium]